MIEKELLSILEDMMASENYGADKKILLKARRFKRLSNKRDNEKAGIINYNDWLSGKLRVKR